MKALLISNSFITRVIVSDDADEAEIMMRTQSKLRQNLSSDFPTSFTSIELDNTIPYCPVDDAVKPYLLAPHLKVVK